VNDVKQLMRRIEKQAQRMKQAEHDQPTMLSQTVFTGVLGLMLVLPIIGGAYAGHWLDSLAAEYSVRWTIGMILLGVIIGAFNVYFFIKERQ
jgi:ATP synthase protein I